MPMCRRACRSAAPESRARSSPSNRISPAVGSTSRLMQRISVDLPVPDAPMIAVMPLRGDLEVDVAQHRLAGDVGLREVLEREHRCRTRRDAARPAVIAVSGYFFLAAAASAASRAVSFS